MKPAPIVSTLFSVPSDRQEGKGYRPLLALLIAGILVLLLSPPAFSSDLKSSASKEAPILSGGGYVGAKPPVCDTATQMLHWNGGSWQCIANPGVGAPAKGSVVGVVTGSCPPGSVSISQIATGQTSGLCSCGGACVTRCTSTTYSNLCVAR